MMGDDVGAMMLVRLKDVASVSNEVPKSSSPNLLTCHALLVPWESCMITSVGRVRSVLGPYSRSPLLTVFTFDVQK